MKRRSLAAATLTPVGVLGVGGVALAFWTVASTGATGTAAAAALAAPASVSTSNVTASSVTIHVDTIPATGPTPTSYRVDRTGPADVVATGICSISDSTGSCADPSPKQGVTNTYAIFSKLGDNWVSATSATTSAAVPSSDSIAPTTTATPSPAGNAAGWHKGDLLVQLASTDNVGGSGVKEITYSAAGAQVIASTTVSGTSTNVGLTTEGTTTISFFATDNADNVESTRTVTIKLDKTGPSNVLSLTGATGSASYLSGSTVYYRGSAAGSFRVQNAVIDVLSTPASSTTALTAATGWTHSGSTVSAPTGGPYVSNAFTWAASTSTSPTATATGRDVADNTAVSNLALTNDVTGPTGGSVSYSSATSQSSSVSVGFAAGTDAGAGVNAGSALLQRASAAYTAGACEAFGSFSTIATTPASSPFADTLPSDGCFTYQYVVSDNLGNTTTHTSPNTVIRDNAIPTVTNVTSALANGNYKAGQVVPVTVTFSEPVTVVGTPTLTLATGSPAGTAVNYTSGSGTNTLTFTYTVAAGNTSADLDYDATTALSAGTSLRDAAGNDAIRTLPTPGAAGSLGANKNLIIDTTPPAAPTGLTLTTAADTGLSNTDGITNVTAPTLTGSAEANSSITLFNGASQIGTGTTNGTGTFTATISPALAQGSFTITATATDAAGNTSGSSSGKSITIDTTKPGAANSDAANKVGQTAGRAEAGDTITLNFGEAMNPATILAGWNGSSTNVVVRGNDPGGSTLDTVTFFNGSNATQLSLGTLTLGAEVYFSGNVTFGLTGTPSTMVLNGSGVVTITLGTVSDATKTGTAGANRKGQLSWSPSSSAADVAGNAADPTAVSHDNLDWF